MDPRKVEELSIITEKVIKRHIVIESDFEEILRTIIRRRLEREGIPGFRQLFSIPEYIPDEQAEKWAIKWVGRRDRIND